MSLQKHGFSETIGNTPLIRLEHLSQLTKCNILGKAEFLNPGGSVKDRAALGMILDAEEKKVIKPGDTIVEGTAGNTGIGLAHVCNARDYKCIIIMPDTQSPEKASFLRALGAEVHEVPAAPYSSEDHFTKIARRMAKEKKGFFTEQFENTANRSFHERTTGQEILKQTNYEVDAFICSVGTGGTIGGVSRALKNYDTNIKVFLADPPGSALHSFIQRGELLAEGSSVTEGIGIGRITPNFADSPVDDSIYIEDLHSIRMVYHLLKTEGFLLGSTSGVNVYGAYKLAQKLGAGSTIVTILCDSGSRYLSRLFNPEWLNEKQLDVNSPFD